LHDEGLTGMTVLGRQLLETGQLRDGIDLAEVRDVLWNYLAIDHYERLVLGQGWSRERYARWLAHAITGALCPEEARVGRPAAALVISRAGRRDPGGFERRARAAAGEHGWDAWFAEPTGADGGHAPTRRALAAGAGLVFAAGGDGTVRACAGALAGTGVPLAIVPLGTANLTARALPVPARAGRAIDAGFGGRDRHIDLGRVDEAGAGAGGTGAGGLVFAAMAGIGLDAAVVGAARPDTKRWLGWVAYAASGVMRLRRPACDFT